MSETPAGFVSAVPRRRNGKQHSCEPCRKSKVACDHTLPACGRCRKKKTAERCIYLAAPMTRQVLAGRSRSSLSVANSVYDRSRSEASTGLAAPRGGELRAPLTTNAGSETVLVGEVDAERDGVVAKPTLESGPFVKSGGFFGPTNFSAVFIENRENLGSSSDFQISQDIPPTLSSSSSLQPQTFLMLAPSDTIGSPRIALGTRVLEALPDFATCLFLLQRYYDRCYDCAFPRPYTLAVAEGLWRTHAQALAEPRETSKIEAISTPLCKNAERALDHFETYDSFVAATTGSNLRWEAVGIVYAALCTAILTLPDNDPFFATQKSESKNRRNFSIKMKDCVQACITLSNYMELINVMMVELLVKNMILQTLISGDVSLIVWRQLGDLVSATTALGLHRQPKTTTVTFASELNRKLFTVVFNIDKGSSLLTGRPPMLSNVYARWETPLDLSQDVLMKGGTELQEAVANLDANGWNKDGHIYLTTAYRARGMLSPVLNEILEFSLGDEEDCTGERIKYLMDKVSSVYASWPSWLKFKLSDLGSPSCSDDTFWRRLFLRMITLEHRLLLERLAYKQGGADGQSMVECAQEMLELTVLIWVQRDRFASRHHDYDWMLMCWGVPSSGVLCVELLKQMKYGSTLSLPRSEIVQNLSLLVGFLDWVKPAAGNYQLCRRMRIIIKSVLDQILNPTPSLIAKDMPSERLENNRIANANGVIEVYDPSLFENGWGEDTENLEWLNNIDWSQGAWFDMGQDFSAAKWG